MNTTDVASEDSEPDQRCERQTPDAPRFIVAHGRKGGWVFNDRLGLVGGIFITEAAADTSRSRRAAIMRMRKSE